VWTQDEAVAAGHSLEPGSCPQLQTQFLDRITGRFARVETRRRFARFLAGMPAVKALPTPTSLHSKL
jgi:hypothetical protein